MMSEQRRVRRRKLLALAIALVGAFLVGEVFVRLTLGAPLPERLPIMQMQANPDRGWMMVPGANHYTYQHLVRVNSLGLRGRELGEKRPGTLRVLALGDSLTYGQGVADDDTLPAYLEVFLNELDPEGRTWEVVNAGHRAYDTRQEVALLAELGWRIEPDVVVVFWYWNDIYERPIRTTYENLSQKDGPVAFDTGGRVEGWAWLRWQAVQVVRHSALAMYLYDRMNGRHHDPIAGKSREVGIAKLGQHLDRLLRMSEKMGFQPWFVVVPDANLIVGTNDSAAVEEDAVALATEKGLPVVRLLPALQALQRATGKVPVIPYDGHYLPAANRAMGRSTAQSLLGLDD